jgi:hypothetical protein
MHQKGISKPYPCPYGSFSIRPGAYACVACPVGTSTNITGNVSPSNCVPCPFGVNALTYRCLDDNSHLNDLCWNSGQLLSLNSSIVVQDLFRLVYEMPIVGMDALMSNTINVIQQSSMSLARPDDVALGAQRLELAPALWLNATKHNLPACQAKLHSQIGSDTGTLINYQFGGGQFGKKWANARINWISYWHFSGRTFGCSGNSLDECPLASSCFAPLYQTFAPVINFPGGLTTLGNERASSLGQYTPQYSPSFVASELTKTIDSLTQWTTTLVTDEKYASLSRQISQSTGQVKS